MENQKGHYGQHIVGDLYDHQYLETLRLTNIQKLKKLWEEEERLQADKYCLKGVDRARKHIAFIDSFMEEDHLPKAA